MAASAEEPAIRSRWQHDAIPAWRPVPPRLVCEVRVSNLDLSVEGHHEFNVHFITRVLVTHFVVLGLECPGTSLADVPGRALRNALAEQSRLPTSDHDLRGAFVLGTCERSS
jgi:hypothetical protein